MTEIIIPTETAIPNCAGETILPCGCRVESEATENETGEERCLVHVITPCNRHTGPWKTRDLNETPTSPAMDT